MFFQRRLSLVTGGAGFIGTHLGQALLNAGGRVRLAIHERAPIIADSRVETVHGDLTDPQDCLRAMEGVQLVFHAAGAVSGAGGSPEDAMAGIVKNLNLTAQVLHAAWAAKVERILIFSSSTVYPATDHPIREDELHEEPPHPSYLGYGRMRRYFEHLAEFVASRSTVKVALVRPTAVYGPHDDFDPSRSHVIPALVRRAVEKADPFEVWGSGNEMRDFLHVEDFARGCLLAIEKHAVCDPVNIGYGSAVSIRQVVETILKAAGHDVRPHFDASRPTTIPVRTVDTSKARRVLGFEPQIPIEAGLSDLVRWYAAQAAS
ncbi:NAD(P)-dependent oxidoreductase [uncultured Bradyrhizobium sp.]|jgi:GDP-L-fucose synthase|uniref:NAD-dependent epimerase/dehydratase family protein n=1 Tax=uncultured Bradyrhizobium sp. TaxID=199684 RepID=UPI002630A57E|nr:NAD-dependent epimerase/dehydratase family protein [uncultured Bradyrhizobium sp.]